MALPSASRIDLADIMDIRGGPRGEAAMVSDHARTGPCLEVLASARENGAEATSGGSSLARGEGQLDGRTYGVSSG